MAKILCISDVMDDVDLFTKEHELFLFKIKQWPPSEHSFNRFQELYNILCKQIDLSSIDLIFAEYVESLPLLYFIRKNGFFCPAIMVPHTNPYPLNILFYFILISTLSHPNDVILCGSENAKVAYEKIVSISAENICTFGIKSLFKPMNKQRCREELNLCLDKRYVLYTGRIMNDKGLTELVEAIDLIRQKIKDVVLIISATHIDHYYYNNIATKLLNSILFYRIDKNTLTKLYNAVDLYASCATSIFETYGKSQLEAIACNTPVIVPSWDGFPYYISKNHGAIAKVNYVEHPINNPFQYARVDINDFATKCCKLLTMKKNPSTKLPEWALYDNTVQTITKLINNILQNEVKKYLEFPNDKPPISLNKLSSSVIRCLKHYNINCLSELIIRSEEKGLISRKDPGEPEILKLLHNDIFCTMDKVKTKII